MKNKPIKRLKGANMKIDLTSGSRKIHWTQDKCPWNESEKNNKHKYVIKNTSIFPYFCEIKYPDEVICCYPNKNPLEEKN